jgi:hypothetical protein
MEVVFKHIAIQHKSIANSCIMLHKCTAHVEDLKRIGKATRPLL